MDDYSLLQIFDCLDINGLINLADISPGFRQLITDHYMIPIFRIHENTIHFSEAKPSETRGGLVLTGYHTYLSFLRNFGHLVTVLEFAVLQGRASVTIFDSIEHHCSDTLVELIMDRPILTINNTNQIFKKVIKLKLKYYWAESDFSAIDKVFPALEELTVEISQPLQSDLARFFPNLKRLHVIEDNLKVFADDGIRKFIATNPQLRAFSLGRAPSYELSRFISENGKNLQELAIKYNSSVMSQYDEVVHFDQITKLTIESEKYHRREEPNPMMAFPQLESLQINAKYTVLVPIELIQQHNISLKSLSFTKAIGTPGVYADILSESGPFQALEEIKLYWQASTGVQHLMTDFETLKKITFIFYQRPGQPLVLDELTSKLQGNWLLSEYFYQTQNPNFDLYDVAISRHN